MKSKQLFKKLNEWIIISCTIFVFVLFSLGNLRYLPVIDFLPYKTGINIADNMLIPDGAPVDVYNTTFIYAKDGIEKEFSLSDYPADDTAWIFVDQKSVIIKKGYQPPIHDFSISSPEGEDLTQLVLSHPGYTLLMISKKLEDPVNNRLSDGFELGSFCAANGIDFYILTASGTSQVKNYNNGLLFCFTDETTLKTIIRANPGYILLKEGTIIGKWSWANVPEKEWFVGHTTQRITK